MKNHRGHKYHLIAFCIVLFAWIAFIMWLEFAARELPNLYRSKQAAIRQKDRLVTTVILGSSHAYYGLNPVFFSSPAINMACVSQDLKYDSIILSNVFELHPELKHVVLPISLFSLYDQLEDSVESWRTSDYRIHMGIDTILGVHALDITRYSIVLTSPQKYLLAKKVISHFWASDRDLVKIDPEWTKDGWGTIYGALGSLPQLEIDGPIAAKRHQHSKSISNAALGNLMAVVNFCRTHHLRLLLFTPPAFKSYRENASIGRLREIHSVVEEVTKSSVDIKYLDLFADPQFSAEDFHDSDHLSAQGASKLSHRIDGELVKW